MADCYVLQVRRDFFPVGFASIGLVLLHASLRPRLLEIASTLAIGAFYLTLYRLLGGALSSSWGFRGVGLLAFAGAGSLVVMVARLLWSLPQEQKARLRLLLAGLTPIVLLVYTPVVFGFFSHAVPDSPDRFLYAFDARFGMQAGFAAGRLFDHVPGLRMLCSFAYLGLPFGHGRGVCCRSRRSR